MLLYKYSSLNVLVGFPEFLKGVLVNQLNMKKIIFSTLVILFTLSVNAQSNFHPLRSTIEVYHNSTFEAVTDPLLIKKYYSYPVANDVVVIKVTPANSKDFYIFTSTKSEYNFLKEQLKYNNLKIIMEGETFMGYSKIVYY